MLLDFPSIPALRAAKEPTAGAMEVSKSLSIKIKGKWSHIQNFGADIRIIFLFCLTII